ncbi:Myo-inositol 2-dehydrogenase [Paramyrothecium foliicola]|nr:Myo-inositol 2-dehydrogenase [Paramyrothecium foliicola]
MPSQKYDALRQLNVGVVGIGRMGRHHAMNILYHVPRANLLCACSPAEADLLWAQYHLMPHGVRVVPTFEEMIETPGLDAVIIASATHLHTSQTTISLQKGLHVLCEKPVCQSVTELETLVNLTEVNPKATLMVGFVRRFDSNYRQALEKIRSNAIGRPVVIRSQGCEIRDESAYYKQYLKDSGGIFVDSVIHDIDLALMFLGEDSKPKSVTAIGVAAVHEQIQAEGDADNGVGMCEFWDGKIAFFYNSRTTAHGYDNATEIFGTEGKLSVNLIPRHNAIELCDRDGYVKTFAHPGWYERYASAFVTEAQSWVDAVLDEQPLPVPLRSSLMSLQIATALQQSLATGQKIFFDQEGNKNSTGV